MSLPALVGDVVKELASDYTGVSSIISAFERSYQKREKKRVRLFFQKLLDLGHPLTNSFFTSEIGVHCFSQAVTVAVNEREDEKIDYLVRLFAGTIKKSDIIDLDDYDYLLSALEKLNITQLLLLKILHDHEKEHGERLRESDNENALENYLNNISSRVKSNGEAKVWNRFLDTATDTLGLGRDRIEEQLYLAESSGCYIASRPQAGNHFPQSGATTKLFDRLVKSSF